MCTPLHRTHLYPIISIKNRFCHTLTHAHMHTCTYAHMRTRTSAHMHTYTHANAHQSQMSTSRSYSQNPKRQTQDATTATPTTARLNNSGSNTTFVAGSGSEVCDTHTRQHTHKHTHTSTHVHTYTNTHMLTHAWT